SVSREVRVTFPRAGRYTIMADASYDAVLPSRSYVTDVGASQVTVDVRDKGSAVRREQAIVTTGVGVTVCASAIGAGDPSIAIVPCDTTPTSPPPPAPGLAQVTGRIQYTGPGL